MALRATNPPLSTIILSIINEAKLGLIMILIMEGNLSKNYEVELQR